MKIRVNWLRVCVLIFGLLTAGCGGWSPFPPTPTPTPLPTATPAPTATLPSTATPPPTVAPPTPTTPPTATPAPPTATSQPTQLAPTPTAPTASGGPGVPGSALAVPTGAIAGGRSAGDPKAPELGNTGYDIVKHTLQLRLDARGKRLAGSATLAMQSTLDRLGQLSLDLVDGFDLGAVTVDGMTTQYTYRDDKLTLNLPRAMRQGESFTIKIDYSGAIRPIRSRYASFSEVGLQVAPDGTIFAISEPDGARAWFPTNDHPLDKALFRFEITVEPPFVAAANGVLVETKTTPEGLQYIWEMRQPMAPYLATVMTALYERLDDQSPSGIPLRHYVYTNRKADAAQLFAVTGEAMDWFVQKLGPYPFDNFGYAMVSLRGASLETQSLVLLSDQMLSEGVLIHELAHMWFGNVVSISSWADIWRNEGFATYFTTLWERRNDPPTELARSMNEIETNLNQRPTTYPLGNPEPAALFAPDSYIKGAWVAHMLHLEVGEDAFFRALRRYFERYKDRVASRAEFEAVFSEVSGKDLTAFFKRWLDTPGLPSLDVTWNTQRVNGSFSLDVQVCQVNGLPYPSELEILAVGPGHAEPLRIPLTTDKQNRVRLTLPFAPETLATDPNERILAREAVQQVGQLSACP